LSVAGKYFKLVHYEIFKVLPNFVLYVRLGRLEEYGFGYPKTLYVTVEEAIDVVRKNTPITVFFNFKKIKGSFS